MKKRMKKLTFECGEQLARCLKGRAIKEDVTQQQLLLRALKCYMEPKCGVCNLCGGNRTNLPEKLETRKAGKSTISQ